MEPSSDPASGPLWKAVQKARLMGLGLCVIWPLILMVMVGAGAVRPGTLQPVGPLRTLAFVFTGLSFLAAAVAIWRTGRALKRFPALAPEAQARVAFRETLLQAALFELSCVYGLVYWMLVGRNAFHHVLTFMAFTPVMFILFAPRLDHWRQAAE